MVFNASFSFLLGFVGSDDGRHEVALLVDARCGQLTPVSSLWLFLFRPERRRRAPTAVGTKFQYWWIDSDKECGERISLQYRMQLMG